MSKITYVTCAFCGRRIPKDKAVPFYRKPAFLPDDVDVQYVGFGVQKLYACISCAKHRGISFADWRRKIVTDDRKHKTRARKRALGRRKRGSRHAKHSSKVDNQN